MRPVLVKVKQGEYLDTPFGDNNVGTWQHWHFDLFRFIFINTRIVA